MQPELFATEEEYGPDFEIAWKAYNHKRSKLDAWRAWGQVTRYRPDMALLLICISEYRAEIKKTKQNQAYFASWLRGKRWNDHMEEARYRLNNPLPKIPPRIRTFKASDYPDIPEESRPKRSYKQILEARRAGEE